MDFQQIVSNASDKAVRMMSSDFIQKSKSSDDYHDEVSSKLKETHPDLYNLSEEFKIMINYCNYLVECALEEYSKNLNS